MNGDEPDASRRYWKAAISTLPAEKRDAAWEFYIDKFAGTSAGDTLAGLILLLEANGVFLLTLPEKLHTELIQPVTEQLTALRKELQAAVEGQRTALRTLDSATDYLEKAHLSIAGASDELAGKVKAAAKQIDVVQLANQVALHLDDAIAVPLSAVKHALPKQCHQIEAATKAAESSIERWHSFHFGEIIFTTVVATLLAVMLVILAWHWYRNG